MRVDGVPSRNSRNGQASGLKSRSVPLQAAVRTIVLVEDQADSREVLRKILAMEGHEEHSAKDGEEEIELILSQRPQVAIIDLGLPKINVIEQRQRAWKQSRANFDSGFS